MVIADKTIDGKACRLYSRGTPRFLLVQMADGHDPEGMEREVSCLSDMTDAPFLLAAVAVDDWNSELSPWPGPAVFGREDFQGKAPETLRWLRESALPALRAEYGLKRGPAVLGGYSLAGLFALWAAHTWNGWAGAAAASPSVWFPGFAEFAARQPLRAQAVYLSLGDREEKTRNPVMGRVGDCIRTLNALYDAMPHVQSTLEWNEGNHFRDPDRRTARAFAWVLNRLKAAPAE